MPQVKAIEHKRAPLPHSVSEDMHGGMSEIVNYREVSMRRQETLLRIPKRSFG